MQQKTTHLLLALFLTQITTLSLGFTSAFAGPYIVHYTPLLIFYPIYSRIFSPDYLPRFYKTAGQDKRKEVKQPTYFPRNDYCLQNETLLGVISLEKYFFPTAAY